MSDLEIRIEYSEKTNQSLAFHGDKIIGRCDYQIKEGKWYITHTVVMSEYGGGGIAKQLVKEVIEQARKRNIKIVPICSYAQKMMLDSDEYKDVL